MNRKHLSCLLTLLFPLIILPGCEKNNDEADGYGNFEATEVMVASQVSGPLILFNPEEGDTVTNGKVVGLIDTIPLDLKRKQLFAQRQAVASKNGGIVTQIDVLNQQKKNLIVDQQRIQNLVKERSVTQKQLDDINGQIDVIDRQITSVESQNSGIAAEIRSMDAQLSQVNDQIKRSFIVNPINGTILKKYAEQSEIVSPGKILYKVANLDTITLRAYIGGAQLSSVRLGQKISVKYDTEKGASGETSGTIAWIASSAEFTPKIVQTKEQRTNLVYAIKISVPNTEGKMKIGMPGEMILSETNSGK